MASFPSNGRFFYYLEVMARRTILLYVFNYPKKKKKEEEEVPSVMTFFYGILYLWFEFHLFSPTLFTLKNKK